MAIPISDPEGSSSGAGSGSSSGDTSNANGKPESLQPQQRRLSAIFGNMEQMELTMDEFVSIMETGFPDMDEESVNNLRCVFSCYDLDHSDTINYNEFFLLLTRLLRKDDETDKLKFLFMCTPPLKQDKIETSTLQVRFTTRRCSHSRVILRWWC
jgi:hypothetical protein